ncbi:uncharacterized protein BYT42DRAFT_573389 [Radiomyces spectabilis]|uniref:uncharacterized protein n=1 Tax=Radiomyces spectabilis TaxID=64574 RepID=UPI0022208C5F|nr:uncharacterized protein BYT42DRAFT_573389 [Radiomyces spectabilis]KAI8376098.1 hypothetical protein BYT42DRAFT_573389 [Radiomyces spectabilis]
MWTSWHWALIVILCIQVSGYELNYSPEEENPGIWEVQVEYDLSISNTSAKVVPGTSQKVYNRGFQTVFAHRDIHGSNSRLLIDVGDGCPGTTIEEIQDRNDHTATSPSMSSQPSIAIMKRDGRCSRWSEKISTVQSLSQNYGLNIQAAVIYDNRSSEFLPQVKQNTTNKTRPEWYMPLLFQYNISYMNDNDIDLGQTWIAVYFVPKAYGESLLQQLQKTLISHNDTKQQYIQLTFLFSDISFSVDGDAAEEDDRPSSDIWDLLSTKSDVFLIVIAACIVLILGFILFRWYRISRWRRSSNTTENDHLGTVEQGAIPLQPRAEVKCLTHEKLEELCPIQSCEQANPTNTACAICLDDFEPDTNLRVLPCLHGFCVACIDVWLTKKSSLCPICKYDCLPNEEDAHRSPTSSSSVAPDSSPVTPNTLPSQDDQARR